MKKILPIVLLFHIFTTGNTQNFKIENNLKTYFLKPGLQSNHVVLIRNNSSTNINLGIRNHSVGLNDHLNLLCLKNDCNVQPEDVKINIAPGEVNNMISLIFQAGITTSKNELMYELFNLENPQEAVSLKLNYVIEDDNSQRLLYKDETLEISPIYPNPITKNFGIIDYRLIDEDQKAKIIVHNILGNQIAEYRLDPKENMLKISTSDLEQGVYFYSLQKNNETIFTRKLIIRK